MNLPDKIQAILRVHQLQKRWRRITAVLAAVVVVVTAAVTILPAITMETGSQAFACQLKQHTHTDSCYDAQGNLICGYADFVVHTHDDSCYDADGTLLCPLPQIEAHTHSAACYRDVTVLTCGMEESEGHVHIEDCYAVAQEPSCGIEESEGHVHTEACYAVAQEPSCGMEESDDHVHTEDCYAVAQEPSCGIEESEGHVHTEACYEAILACEQEQTPGHTHTDSCYSIQQELVCQQEEIILHTHSAACYDENNQLICGMMQVMEHVHDQTCLPAPADQDASKTQIAGAKSIDFSDMITKMTLQVQEGNYWVDVSDGTVTEGSSLFMRIEFTVASGTLSAANRTIHYQLPTGIQIQSPEEGPLDYMDGNPAGTYTIDTNGYIQIVFDEDFPVDQNFSGYLEFSGEAALLEGEESQIIHLGGSGGTITIVPAEQQIELGIAKTGTYLAENKQIAYEIVISSENGTQEQPIRVTDAFGHAVSYGNILYNTDSLTIQKRSGEVTQTLDPSQYQVSWKQQDAQTPGSWTIEALPPLQAGESYCIRYTATPDLEQSGDSNGYLEFSNTATAQAGDQSVQSTARVTVSQAILHKEIVTYDEYTRSVTWKIIIRNPDGRDLAGEQLQDTMSFWPNGASEASWVSPPTNVDLHIVAYNYTDVNFNTPLGETDLPAQTFPITFPQGSTYSYIITYTTVLPEDLATQTGYFNNQAIFLGHTVNVGNYFEIPDLVGYGVVKQLWSYDKGKQTADGSQATILEWGSVITYPQDAIKENIVYIDYIGDVVTADGTKLPGRHYTTASILYKYWVNVVSYDWQTFLDYGQDYTIYVLPSSATAQATQEKFLQTEFNQFSRLPWVELSFLIGGANADEPISMICVVLTDKGWAKLGGKPLTIQYATILETEGLEAGTSITAHNLARIPSAWSEATYEEKFLARLDKQVSFTAPGSMGADVSFFADTPTGSIGADGLIHYRLLLTDFLQAGSDSTTVTDLLPAGAQLVENSIYLVRHNQYADTVYEGSFTQDPAYIQYSTAPGENGTTAVTFTLSDLNLHADVEVLAIYYSVSVADDPAWNSQTSKDYVNTASWGGETDSTSTTVSQTLPVLKKTGEQLPLTETNGKIVLRYYVLVNPYGKQLMENSGETLTLSDTLTIPEGTSCQLLLENAQICHYDPSAENGVGQPLEEGTYHIQYDGNSRVLTVELPDATACVVVYDYQIDRSDSHIIQLNINNQANLEGYATQDSSYGMVVEDQSSSGGVNTANLIIYKVDSKNYAELLNGALFRLERFEQQDGGEYLWTQTSITAADPGESGDFITGGDGPDGQIILNFLQGEGGSRYNTLYRIWETRAPEGYQISSSSYRYFVWMNQNTTVEETIAAMDPAFEAAEVDSSQVIYIPYNANQSFYIPNEPDTTSIQVEKQWVNAMGEPLTEDLPASITLTLYQHLGEDVTPYGQPVTVQPDSDGNWSYTWGKLPKQAEDGSSYSYTVQETPVEGYETSYTYPEGTDEQTGASSGTIVIRNTKTSSYILPETGGNGLGAVLASGALLLGAAGAGSLYAKRRRGKGGIAR